MSLAKFIFGLSAIKKALANRKTQMEKEFELNENEDDFASHFYDEVNNVIGGTNPNEKLTLLLPGIALTKSDFEYDYKNNAPKGPVIEANESRLANKLYDPFDMVGGDNGKTLEHQYRSALDMLTPKLNPIIAHAKNNLRELLMKPFPYKFGPKNIMRAEILKVGTDVNGKYTLTWEKAPVDAEEPVSEETKTYTFQEVFFRLYNDYVDQLGEWADERQRRKEYYQKKAQNNSDLSDSGKNRQSENEYLEWYENNGEKWLTAVNQKLSVLLSIFSATDMKIVEGILDSGSGAELQEARQTLNNTRKVNPDGGYIYPVKFNPTNWFEYLDTSFTPVDLVNSPTAILDELKLLYSRRDYLNTRITDIAAQIPSTKDIEDAKKQVEDARTEFNRCDDALQDAMDNAFGDFAKFLTVAICDACCPPAGAAALATNKKSIDEGSKTATEVLENATKGSTDKTKTKVENILTTAADTKKDENENKFTGLLDTIKNAVPTLNDAVEKAKTAYSTLKSSVTDENKKTLNEAIDKLVKNTEIASVVETATATLNNKNTPSDKQEEAQKAIEDAESAKVAVGELTKAKDDVEKDLSTNTKTQLQGTPKEGDDLQKVKTDLNIGSTISTGIEIVFEGGTKVNMAQSAYLTSISNYTEKLLKASEVNTLANLHLQLTNLNIDKNTVENKIKLLQNKLSRVDNFDECFSDSVNPPAVPDGFTQFNIVHTVTNTSSQTNETHSSTTSSSTSGFWIFKSKKRTTHTESHIEQLCKSCGTEIQIGMNVAKVGIEREWFNPGVFALTGEMYNVADKTTNGSASTDAGEDSDPVLRISHGANKEDAAAMEKLSHDVFPCYTTAMVIARDVTIKLSTTSSADYSKLDSATDEVSKSKAFFVYNAGDGSRTHTSKGKSKSKSDSRAITVRFTTPQIIGFYQQIVPKDESAPYPKDQEITEEKSIVKFIEAYEKVIANRRNAESAG